MALAETTGPSGVRVTMEATVRGEPWQVTWEDGRLTGDPELIARAERDGRRDDRRRDRGRRRRPAGGRRVDHPPYRADSDDQRSSLKMTCWRTLGSYFFSSIRSRVFVLFLRVTYV